MPTVTFHLRVSASGHALGAVNDTIAPSRFGPRHCSQSADRDCAASVAEKTHNKKKTAARGEAVEPRSRSSFDRLRTSDVPDRCHAVGLKYSTMAAPIEASRNPRYSIGFTAALGGWMMAVMATFTIGAPPNTSGIT